MTCKLSWLVENRVIHVHCSGGIKLADLKDVDVGINADYLDQVPTDNPNVHLVIDITEIDNLPVRVDQLSRAFTHLHHPKMGWSLVVTNNKLIDFMGDIVSRIARKNFRSFSSMDEAIAFLREADETLSDISPPR